MTEGQALQNPDGSPFLLFDLPKTQMIFVEKGTFNIGDNNSGRYDEKEATIQFEQGYYMGQYAVTQELYEKVMGQNPCEFKEIGRAHV